MNDKMPVFIKIDEYKQVIEIMKLVKEKLDGAKRMLQKIDELKNKEDAELESWRMNLADIEKKMDDIDDSMFGPETF